MKRVLGGAALIVIFVAGGIVGGIAGGTYALRHGSGVLGVLQSSSSMQSDKPQIAPESAVAVARAEEAATIAVVKSAAPAVVSIRISKEVALNSRNSGNGDPDPFGDLNDLFGYMFPQLAPTVPAPKVGSDKQAKPETQKQTIGGGSGFIVSADGLIATNKHVASDTDAIYTVITSDGKEYDAKIIARDPVVDVAILKIEAQNLPTLSFGDSDQVRIGETVIAIGNALAEFQNSVTKGIISGTNRRVQAGGGGMNEVIEEAIQTDAAINPGNSGGPLLDLDGHVIGVNTAIDRSGQLIGFAIPSNVVKRIVESVQKNGRIVRPWIGVRYVLLDQREDMAKALGVTNGALILSSSADEPAVVKGSPAEKAGLKERDIILKVNATEINSDHSLSGVVAKFAPGDVVNLTIRRDGKEMAIPLTLAEFDEQAVVGKKK